MGAVEQPLSSASITTLKSVAAVQKKNKKTYNYFLEEYTPWDFKKVIIKLYDFEEIIQSYLKCYTRRIQTLVITDDE